MDPNTFPTKGNLILAKNSLKLAHMGYELMDKKRNILIRELMGLIDEAKDIQRQIDVTFRSDTFALSSVCSVCVFSSMVLKFCSLIRPAIISS